MTKKPNRNAKKDMLEGHISETGAPRKNANPDWARGLRQLYDSVVDEPLPDSFMDLLAKLDDDKQ
jgi:hypothetical protein